MPSRPDQNHFTWEDLRLPGEVLRAFGRDWEIHVFTGRLTAPESSGPRSFSVFTDGSGRTKNITLIHEKIDKSLLREMKVGDKLSMAFFVDDQGYDASYFLLYDHARQREYSVVFDGVHDLSHDGRKAGLSLRRMWDDARVPYTFGSSPQYKRILEIIKAR